MGGQGGWERGRWKADHKSGGAEGGHVLPSPAAPPRSLRDGSLWAVVVALATAVAIFLHVLAMAARAMRGGAARVWPVVRTAAATSLALDALPPAR